MNIKGPWTAGRYELARLAVIRSRVSSCCQVVPEKVDFSDEDLRRQHDEVSRATSKSLLVLVAFAFFCELILGTPDSSLVADDARITLPLVGTAIYVSEPLSLPHSFGN